MYACRLHNKMRMKRLKKEGGKWRRGEKKLDVRAPTSMKQETCDEIVKLVSFHGYTCLLALACSIIQWILTLWHSVMHTSLYFWELHYYYTIYLGYLLEALFLFHTTHTFRLQQYKCSPILSFLLSNLGFVLKN